MESGEPTIVVSKLAPRQEPLQPAAIKLPPSEPPSRSSSQISQASSVEPQTPVQVEKQPTVPPSTKTKVKRIRITSETERICVWILSYLAMFASLTSIIGEDLEYSCRFTCARKQFPIRRKTASKRERYNVSPYFEYVSSC